MVKNEDPVNTSAHGELLVNITNLTDFPEALDLIRKTKIVVFDTETNGLHIHQGAQMISISVYLPEFNQSFNFPFRHGVGTVQGVTGDFENSTWQGDGKKLAYLAYWFDQMKEKVDFENLPIECLDQLKAVWALPGVLYIGHNAKFDLHVLANEGFPEPEMVHDTMVALHTIHEDWKGIKFTAPFTWAKSDVAKGLCAKVDVGTWARDGQGKLQTRSQYGNRQLKWQAARLGLPGSTDGEEGLHKSIKTFEGQMALYVMDHWEDDMNSGLILVTFTRAVDKNKMIEELWSKQLAKIEAKIEIDDKAHMWMLPSSAVAPYAELDTELTYGLYKWCMETLKSWDNETLFAEMSRIHYHLAYRMERNGLKLDVQQAQAEITKLDPRIADLENIISQITVGLCWDNPQLIGAFDETGCNLASPKQLLVFLNSGVLSENMADSLWPSWFEQELRLDLTTYTGAVIKATDKEALEPYEDSAIVRIIREHRRMNKSANTYLSNWLNARDDNDIVHGSFDATGTTTGRVSSSGDAGNLQNVPDRNGYTIKRAFVAYGEGWRLAAIDYSQLELKLAAWIAEGLLGFDPNMTMTNLFLSGNDMHSYVRDMVNIRNVMYEDMTTREILVKMGYTEWDEEEAEDIVASNLRKTAKVMNFGLLYSGTEFMLSRLLKIPKPTAKVLVNEWRKLFPAFPKAQEYHTKLALTYRKRPVGDLLSMYVTQPISGRHRRIDMYPTWMTFWKDGMEQGFNPREAEAAKTWNSRVQGLGGYLCMMSGTKFVEACGNEHLKTFANVHDALELQYKEGHEDLIYKLRDTMIDWPEIVPNLTAAVAISDGSWQDLKEIEGWDALNSKWIYPPKKEKK